MTRSLQALLAAAIALALPTSARAGGRCRERSESRALGRAHCAHGFGTSWMKPTGIHLEETFELDQVFHMIPLGGRSFELDSGSGNSTRVVGTMRGGALGGGNAWITSARASWPLVLAWGPVQWNVVVLEGGGGVATARDLGGLFYLRAATQLGVAETWKHLLFRADVAVGGGTLQGGLSSAYTGPACWAESDFFVVTPSVGVEAFLTPHVAMGAFIEANALASDYAAGLGFRFSITPYQGLR